MSNVSNGKFIFAGNKVTWNIFDFLQGNYALNVLPVLFKRTVG